MKDVGKDTKLQRRLVWYLMSDRVKSEELCGSGLCDAEHNVRTKENKCCRKMELIFLHKNHSMIGINLGLLYETSNGGVFQIFCL